MKRNTLILSSLIATSQVLAQDRPNIILFLVDDMGVMDTSVPFLTDKDGQVETHPLNQWYRTPNMERLAAQGIRFSTFYAQSVSSPSRTSKAGACCPALPYMAFSTDSAPLPTKQP